MAWDQESITGLLDCPPASLQWAALGYRVGWRDGRYELLSVEAEANAQIAALARTTLKQPPWHEIIHRREPSTERCRSPRCGDSCSQCIRALAVEANRRRFGRDDYPGRDARQAVA